MVDGMKKTAWDVAVIGAGVVGCAIARELSRTGSSVVVLEASSDVGNGTSKANTAILHTGFDTVPGSLESRLVTEGYHLLKAYASDANIAVEATGALLVAWDEEQEATLESLRDKAWKNGISDVDFVDAQRVRMREPNLGPGARSGLEVPGESIIDPWSVTIAYATEAQRNGATILRRAEVRSIEPSSDVYELVTSQGTIRARYIVNAAGLQSDAVNEMFGHQEFTIVPRRGQLIVFDKFARSLVNEIILPVPTERTKGVLISPTAWGNVLLGPTAEDLDDRNDTRTTEVGIAQLLADGRRIMPQLVDEEIIATYAGLRAATEHRDYQIEFDAAQRYVCVGGIRSTGLTGSLGIARYVLDLLATSDLDLGTRDDVAAIPTMPPLGRLQRRPSFDREKIEEDPAYGEILCHCEQVSLGEIRDACHSELPPLDAEGLRRRTRAHNGRCQGFSCGGAFAALVATELAQ
jgi:glycerol-3-phosphate dehydrogenase